MHESLWSKYKSYESMYMVSFPITANSASLCCLQSCMSHRLWVIYPGTCLRVWDVSWGLLEDVWFRIVPYLQGFRLGRGAVSYQVCFNTVMEQSERQLSSYWQMVVCVCVCVCSCLGWGFQFVGGREMEFGEEEEVESFRERSAEAQLVRPPV